jgi:quinolinate synthase
VLLPDMQAGCRMADMVTADDLRKKKREMPGATVVCYVNSSAEVKAESDYCCTSANAEKVIESLDRSGEVLFVPDQYLGHYVGSKTGRKMTLWPGYCPTHLRILPEHVRRIRGEYPRATVMVHPECSPEVIGLADAVLSTGGMCRYVKESDAQEIVVGTEIGMIHRLRKESPGKRFIPISEQAICPRMKLMSPEKILRALEDMAPVVKVEEGTRLRAKRAVDRMLEIGG